MTSPVHRTHRLRGLLLKSTTWRFLQKRMLSGISHISETEAELIGKMHSSVTIKWNKQTNKRNENLKSTWKQKSQPKFCNLMKKQKQNKRYQFYTNNTKFYIPFHSPILWNSMCHSNHMTYHSSTCRLSLQFILSKASLMTI